jgi:hypothetical protein
MDNVKRKKATTVNHVPTSKVFRDELSKKYQADIYPSISHLVTIMWWAVKNKECYFSAKYLM